MEPPLTVEAWCKTGNLTILARWLVLDIPHCFYVVFSIPAVIKAVLELISYRADKKAPVLLARLAFSGHLRNLYAFDILKI